MQRNSSGSRACAPTMRLSGVRRNVKARSLRGEVSGKRRRGTWMRPSCASPGSGCICSVPSMGMARRWILFVGNARPGSCQDLPEEALWPPPTIDLPRCSPGTVCGAIRQWFETYRKRVRFGIFAGSGRGDTAITGSEPDHRHAKRRLRAMQRPRTKATAWAVMQDRGDAVHSERASARNHRAQPARASVGFGALLRIA